MRKFAGITIIAFSLLLGLCCAIAFHQEVIVANIMFWMISLPLYIMGQITRTSKSEFKYRGKPWVLNYIFFFFIYPLLTYLYGSYNDLKENTFVDEQFIIYEPVSGTLGELSFGAFVLLLFLFAARFLNPDLKRKSLLNIIIIGNVIFLIAFNYLMFSDYRGIHEEKGLITSNWRGEQHIISYEEIEGIYLVPYVHYASLSNASDETRFVWKVVFQPSNQNEVVYRYQMMTESNLEQTMDMKKVAKENDIPFIVGEMSQEILKWFDIDLKYEELDKGRYYELFQVSTN